MFITARVVTSNAIIVLWYIRATNTGWGDFNTSTFMSIVSGVDAAMIGFLIIYGFGAKANRSSYVAI
uniref:7TM_GPCR_Srx domain-containing protein n=1 Tax=Steinernema glaseri TaxID=37863 RepID=A0A1I7ZKA3_9BILA